MVAGNDATAADVNSNFTEIWAALAPTLLAGETLTAKTPGFIASGVVVRDYVENRANNTAGNAIYGSNEQTGQTFKTPASPAGSIGLISLMAYLERTGTPTGNLQIDVYAVTAGHLPTGATLGTATVTAASITHQAYNTITFSSPISLSAGTEYAVVISTPSGDGSNYFKWRYQSGSGSPNPNILEGYMVVKAGGSWSLQAGSDCDCRITYQYTFGTTGRVYESDATDPDRNQFDGIISAAASGGANVQLQTHGVAEGLTGLTANQRTYVEGKKTLFLSQETISTNYNVVGVNWLAQTFTVPTGITTITRVGLQMKMSNTPVDPIQVSIRATSGNLPTGSDLTTAVSRSIAPELGSSSVRWIYFDFATPVTVTPGSVYAIVIRLASSSGSNTVDVAYNSGGNVYTGGQVATSSNSGSSWSGATNDDVSFRLYGHTGVKFTPTAPEYDVAIGRAVATTKLSIDKVEDYLIKKESINEANTLGASSSCEATYYVPKRARRILINITSTHNGNADADMAGQIVLYRSGATVGYLRQNYGAAVATNMILTATWSGDNLTINAFRTTGTAIFIGDIYYYGQ